MGRLAKFIAVAALLAAAALGAVCAALAAVPALFGREVGAGFASVEQSACVLDRDGSAGILVAGDSRAKSQLIPSLIADRTGRRCVNIAESLDFGGDLATLVNVLRKNPLMLADHPLLIVSVSMVGVNDMSLGSAPAATLFNLDLADHLRLLARRPEEHARFLAVRLFPALRREFVHRRRGDGFACGDDVYLAPSLAASLGYRPFQGQSRGFLDVDEGTPERYLLDGARWRVFRESLRWLAASPAALVVLYDAPLDSEWRERVRGSETLKSLLEFAAMAGREASLYPSVRWLDFVSRPDPDAELAHADFYNGNHLNAAGAEKFTRRMADTLAFMLESPASRPSPGL